jgi:hypothetical protein
MTETNSDTGRNVPARPNRAITPAEYAATTADLVVLSGADHGEPDLVVPRDYAQVIELLEKLLADDGYNRYRSEIESLYYAAAEYWPAFDGNVAVPVGGS